MKRLLVPLTLWVSVLQLNSMCCASGVNDNTKSASLHQKAVYDLGGSFFHYIGQYGQHLADEGHFKEARSVARDAVIHSFNYWLRSRDFDRHPTIVFQMQKCYYLLSTSEIGDDVKVYYIDPYAAIGSHYKVSRAFGSDEEYRSICAEFVEFISQWKP